MPPQLDERGALVVATADEAEWMSLLPLLSGSHIPKRAVTIEECSRHLARGAVSVILADRDLPDGTWRDLLRLAKSTSPEPRVVVLDRDADDWLWLDVLDAGGFDLLPNPVDAEQLQRTIEGAETQWRKSGPAAA